MRSSGEKMLSTFSIDSLWGSYAMCGAAVDTIV